MSIVDQLDVNLHNDVTIDVRRIPGGGLFISLGERDEETVRILTSDATAARLTATIDNQLTGQGDDLP